MLFQFFIILCALVFLALVFIQVSRKRLLLRYSLLWVLLAFVVIIGALFPDIIFWFSGLANFKTPSNFIFFVAIFFLLLLSLFLSAVVSKQASKIKSLIQESALMKNQLEKIESGLSEKEL